LTPIDGQENQMMEIGVSQLVCQFDESLAFSSDIEEQRVLLRKQCEEAENLLNSNDTRRFIGAENSIIVKALQSVIQYQTPSKSRFYFCCLCQHLFP
jgi:hypothetical protein